MSNWSDHLTRYFMYFSVKNVFPFPEIQKKIDLATIHINSF